MATKYTSLSNLLTGAHMNLKNIVRMGIYPRVTDETVAEHSFYVAFFTLVLGSEHNENIKGTDARKINIERAVTKALLHDLEESVTGDIINSYKHCNRDLKTKMDIENLNVCATVCRGLSAHSSVNALVYTRWRFAKDPGTIEGKLVNFCDWLSWLSLLHKEFSMGNKIAIENMQRVRDDAKRFLGPDYDFIKGYTSQALSFISNLGFLSGDVKR